MNIYYQGNGHFDFVTKWIEEKKTQVTSLKECDFVYIHDFPYIDSYPKNVLELVNNPLTYVSTLYNKDECSSKAKLFLDALKENKPVLLTQNAYLLLAIHLGARFVGKYAEKGGYNSPILLNTGGIINTSYLNTNVFDWSDANPFLYRVLAICKTEPGKMVYTTHPYKYESYGVESAELVSSVGLKCIAFTGSLPASYSDPNKAIENICNFFITNTKQKSKSKTRTK